MGKKDWNGGEVGNERYGKDADARGWSDPRRDDTDRTPTSEPRLTDQERYGTTYGNHGK
jgi:hypothetical protein